VSSNLISLLIINYKKSYFRLIVIFREKVQFKKEGYDVILNQEGVRHMSVQGSSTQNNQEKFHQEKALVSAVIKYFEAAPSRQSKAENTESAVINAFYRYYDTKLPQDYSK